MRMHTTIVAAATACLTGGLHFFSSGLAHPSGTSESRTTHVESDNCGCGTASTPALAGALGSAQDAEKGVTVDAQSDDEEHTRAYAWHLHPFAFLVNGFKTAGINQQEAIEKATVIMSQTNSAAVREPKQFLRYGFEAIGWEDDRASAAAEAAVKKLAEHHGELRSLGGKATVSGTNRRMSMNSRSFYLWTGSLFSSVSQAFKMVGMDGQEAIDKTTLALELMDLRDEDSVRNQQEDWREIEPHILLTEAFATIGFDDIAARQFALMALGKMNVKGYLPRLGQTIDKCAAYQVKIIWCDGEGEQVSQTTYVRRNSWNGLTSTCPESSACPTGCPWYELTLKDDACLPTPGEGTCVWVRVTGALVEVPCEEAPITLDCFEETSPSIDCNEIEQTCGNCTYGPQGCPSCD